MLTASKANKTPRRLKRKTLPPAETPWSTEKFQALAEEIDTVRTEISSQLGQEDLNYISKIRRVSQGSEIVGRTLLYLSFEPFAWGMGVLSLFIHKQLEAIEIGHSALHGCWDLLAGAEEFHSKNFKWDTPVEEESWKRGHNQLHHQYTNIVGRDPDLHFGPLRMSYQTSWLPQHVVQISLFFFTAPFFPWMVNLHMTGLTNLSHPHSPKEYAEVLPDRSLKSILGAGIQSARKMLPYFLYNFVFWPVLAGPWGWKVLFGNVAADVIRDIYTCCTIYAGHFGEDLKYYDPSFKAQGRGQWYKAQIEAAHDFIVPKTLSLLCGALDYQIEHHLFPKFPPNRLRQIQPRIEEICRRYGVSYSRESWGTVLQRTFSKLLKMSFPVTKSSTA